MEPLWILNRLRNSKWKKSNQVTILKKSNQVTILTKSLPTAPSLGAVPGCILLSGSSIKLGEIASMANKLASPTWDPWSSVGHRRCRS
jgi:hypothetical protein